jgi:hypothetical protein
MQQIEYHHNNVTLEEVCTWFPEKIKGDKLMKYFFQPTKCIKKSGLPESSPL